jgi:hypothetical protein
MHMKDTHPLNFMSDKHETAFKHKCSYCPQLFTYSTHRDSHVKFNHTAPSFACNLCLRDSFQIRLVWPQPHAR